jgi:hypothetical protein
VALNVIEFFHPYMVGFLLHEKDRLLRGEGEKAGDTD